jgi:uncharacterized protein YkwD
MAAAASRIAATRVYPYEDFFMCLTNRFVGGLVTLAVFFSVSAIAQQKTSDVERALLNSINQERTAHGLGALQWNDALADSARKHAQRMASHGSISHQFSGEPDLAARARAAGVHYTWLAENVDEGPNAPTIHQSFMKSAPHRANILDGDMDSAGIGVVARRGQLFAVEDFAKVK